jgi:hypothetical protein
MRFSTHRAIGLTAAALLAAACGKSDQQNTAAADSTRNLQMAPNDTMHAMNDAPAASSSGAQPTRSRPKSSTPTMNKPSTPMSSARTLAAGTKFEATAQDTISTRQIKPPYAFNASVEGDVLDKNGKVVIPAGSVLRIRLTSFASAPNKSAKDGTIAAILLKATINGKDYTPSVTIDSIAHLLKGRGVTAGTAAKVGGGAAAGAVIGGLIGKTKGAVIGGIVGAGAGTAVAVESGDRDVVIVPGSHIYMTATSDFTP